MKASLPSSSCIGNEVNLDSSYDGALASVDLPLGAVGGPYPCLRELLLACEEDEKGLFTSQSISLEKRYLKVGMLIANSFGPIGMPTPPRQTNGTSSFEISSLIRRPSTNRWTRFIRPALDIYEQNVEIIKTKESYHVITTKTILAGQQLFVWFGKELAAELGLNFLNRINIKDMNTYKCHLCSRQFRRPNPLKSHLLLRHPPINPSFGLEKLDGHAYQTPIGSRDKVIRGQVFHVFSQPCFSHQGPHFLPMIGALPGHDLNFRDLSWPNENPYNRPRVYHHHHHPMKPTQRHLLTDLMGLYNRNPFNPLPMASYPIAHQKPIAWSNQLSHASICPRYDSTPEPKEDASSKFKRSTGNELKAITPDKSDEAGSSKTDSENLKLSEAEQESDEHQRFLFKDGIRTRHGYICPYCGKLYSRKYGLKIHVRTHTGFKPLKCKICQRPFGDPSNLNKHVRLHAEGDTPYRCDQCGKVLVRRRDLERHIRSRHSEHLLESQDGLEKSSPIHQQQTVSSSADVSDECDADLDV